VKKAKGTIMRRDISAFSAPWPTIISDSTLSFDAGRRFPARREGERLRGITWSKCTQKRGFPSPLYRNDTKQGILIAQVRGICLKVLVLKRLIAKEPLA
jgi:hypothetical protein